MLFRGGQNMGFFNGGRTGATAPQKPVVLDDITAYWDSLRDGGDVPYRGDVDPRAIQKVLKNAFILERIAPGMARLRVSCNTLTDLMGMDMRGMPISSLMAHDSQENFGHILEDVFSGPAVGKLELSCSRGFGRSIVKAEILLLPLKNDKGEVNRILGAITCDSPIRNEPHRFELNGSLVRQIETPPKIALASIAQTPKTPSNVTLADITPAKVGRGPVRPLDIDFDQNASELAAAAELLSLTKPTRHSHLRLVVTEA